MGKLVMQDRRNLSECRNCGSRNAFILNQGNIAPFFLKRVHNIELNSLGQQIENQLDRLSNALIKKTLKLCFQVLDNTKSGKQIIDFRSHATTNIRVCKECGFVGPDHNYTFDELLNLYKDYRSDSYNSERSLFEPGYENIQDLVGKSESEINQRLNNMSDLIGQHVHLQSIKKVLDWGGGEGKFVPIELRNKEVFILDVSSEPLADQTFIRIEQPTLDAKFDFVQICHVLEHVSSPRDFSKNVLSYLNTGGYLYIEVPQGRNEDEIQQFVKAHPSVTHKIHEHLNLFTVQSIQALANSLDLKELTVETKHFDFEWCKPTVISGLFMKT
jgi:SAM-dependent methyltransferase